MESKQVEEHRGHVVVVPYPVQSHINPLLQFAKHLVSKGIKATLATTHYTLNSIHTTTTVGVEAISDGFNESGLSQAPNAEAYLESFKTVGSRTLSELIRKFENSEWPVDCIIYDAFLLWAVDVAKQHGIYTASFFTYSATVCSIFCHLCHGHITLPVEQDAMVLIDGLPPLGHSDLPTYLQLPESYPAFLKMNANQFSNLKLVDWIFCNTFDALEGEVAKATSELWPVKFIGPMIPSSYLDGLTEDDRSYGSNLWQPLTDECLKWLDSKPQTSVIFISFGSIIALTISQMEELAWGLKECNWNFLWAVKESEQSKLPNGFSESIQEKGLVVTWCNQVEVLAHQAIGCFITHCGWNSIMEAMSLGVPMVGVPKWVDQTANATFIEGVWGIGVRAKEDENGVLGREELQRCVREVMEGIRSQDIKKNIWKWRELGKEAMREGGSSDDNINEFVNHLRSCKNK